MTTLIEAARAYTGSQNQQKACAYLQEWAAKWRPAEYLQFVRTYRNMPTDDGAGFSMINSFKYFASKANQSQALAYLEQVVSKYDKGSVLKHFNLQYRVEAQIVVPYWPQTDTKYAGWADISCNVSACAMMMSAYGFKISDDDELLKHAINEGAVSTTDHDFMTYLLKKYYGFNSKFVYNATYAQLDAELAKGPVVLGILHRGEDASPAGSGHMITAIKPGKGGTKLGGAIVNDPYGSCLPGDQYTGPVANGKNVLYPAKTFGPRWAVEGDGSGWARFAVQLFSCSVKLCYS